MFQPVKHTAVCIGLLFSLLSYQEYLRKVKCGEALVYSNPLDLLSGQGFPCTDWNSLWDFSITEHNLHWFWSLWVKAGVSCAVPGYLVPRKLLPKLDDNSVLGKKAMGFSTPFGFGLSSVSARTVVKCLWLQAVTGEALVCAFTRNSTRTHEREQPAHTAQLMPGLCCRGKYHLNKTSRQKTI